MNYKVEQFYNNLKGKKVALMANDELIEEFKELASATYSLGTPHDISMMNRLLFDGLRVLDKSDSDIILAEASPKVGQGLAYINVSLILYQKSPFQ